MAPKDVRSIEMKLPNKGHNHEIQHAGGTERSTRNKEYQDQGTKKTCSIEAALGRSTEQLL